AAYQACAQGLRPEEVTSALQSFSASHLSPHNTAPTEDLRRDLRRYFIAERRVHAKLVDGWVKREKLDLACRRAAGERLPWYSDAEIRKMCD
ncbi:MAG TPA: hypothetical protein VFB99_06875, partial [Vicinamibacterales bacterium]|nr:hypothetical protein [Vicinamibacterales bacterium]